MKYQLFLNSFILSIGIAGGTYFISKSIKSNNELIEVDGRSERIVNLI